MDSIYLEFPYPKTTEEFNEFAERFKVEAFLAAPDIIEWFNTPICGETPFETLVKSHREFIIKYLV